MITRGRLNSLVQVQNFINCLCVNGINFDLFLEWKAKTSLLSREYNKNDLEKDIYFLRMIATLSGYFRRIFSSKNAQIRNYLEACEKKVQTGEVSESEYLDICKKSQNLYKESANLHKFCKSCFRLFKHHNKEIPLSVVLNDIEFHIETLEIHAKPMFWRTSDDMEELKHEDAQLDALHEAQGQHGQQLQIDSSETLSTGVSGVSDVTDDTTRELRDFYRY